MFPTGVSVVGVADMQTRKIVQMLLIGVSKKINTEKAENPEKSRHNY